ncbi:hypothetical protein AB0C02_28135 [Micromonospora sp. NPDC048999]|uniref:hypothetical protein n=1 Tax=Micromonospora sp. NPDC048999 TaxID=3155391 RepID=UPI0033F76E9E
MDDTSAHAESPEVPNGVWVHPSGTRFEASRRDDRWHVAVYWVRKGGSPHAEYAFDTPAAALGAIAGMESQGYVRDPGRAPGEPEPQPQPQSQWTPASVAGALVFLVVVLVVGFAILS